MIEKFIQFVKEKDLFDQKQKVLLAVSGGIDSMVLLHLFEKSGFDYGIAHCNFQLRGDESALDEEFVKKQVLIHGVPSFFETFETEEYSVLQGISIEMAARELRYGFFEKIRAENNFDFVATAHHLDDLIETYNYLIGLEVEEVNFSFSKTNRRDYLFISGKIRETKVLIIWRDNSNLNLASDREFIKKVKKLRNYSEIHINGSNAIPNTIKSNEIFHSFLSHAYFSK